MARSKAIKELANNEIELDVALNRLLIIASDIGNDELAKWAEKELNGYSDIDAIPFYRIAKHTIVQYSGINGGYKVKNIPLPLQKLIDPENKNMLDVNLTEGIGTIKTFTQNKENHKVMRDLTYLAGTVEELTGIQCYSIQQIIPENVFTNILNTVKTMLLKIFIQLDKSYGSLDELDINTTEKTQEEINQINTTINNYFHISNSVTIGDHNKIDDSNVLSGG